MNDYLSILKSFNEIFKVSGAILLPSEIQISFIYSFKEPIDKLVCSVLWLVWRNDKHNRLTSGDLLSNDWRVISFNNSKKKAYCSII